MILYRYNCSLKFYKKNDNSADAMIARILSYIDEIWGIRTFHDYSRISDNCCGADEFEWVDFVVNKQEYPEFNTWKGNTTPRDISDYDIFLLLNALFENVYMDTWVNSEVYSCYTIHYPNMTYEEEGYEVTDEGINSLNHCSRLRPIAPSENMVDVLIEKSADTADTVLTAMLLDVKNRIRNGLLPDPETVKNYLKRSRKNLQHRIENSKRLISSWRKPLLEQLESCEDEAAMAVISERLDCARKIYDCRYFEAEERKVLLEAVLKVQNWEDTCAVQEMYEKMEEAYEIRAAERRRVQAKKRALRLKQEQLLSEIRPLEARLADMRSRFEALDDISLIGTEVMTDQGSGTVIEQEFARILVKIGSDTRRYMLRPDCAKRPRFKGDEKTVEVLSEKYSLSIEMKRTEQKLAELQAKFDALPTDIPQR